MFIPGLWRSGRDLNRWLEGHRARLVRLAWAWSGDPVLADDLVQEAYSRAVRASHSLRDIDRADAWIIRIMHRVYLDHLKSAVRRERPVDDIEGETDAGFPEVSLDPGPESRAIDRQRAHRVRTAVGTLPPGQRQVLSLVDLEGMSYADCAAVLDIPVGTVMSRLNRARAALRRRLSADFGPVAGCDRARLTRIK